MNLEKEFIPYEQALELKELGFDEPCFGFFNKTWNKEKEILFPQYAGELENWNNTQHLCSAPLYQQAFRWFREKHQISPSIHCMSEQGNSWRYHIPNEGGETNFSTYEEAELACLIKLIETVKNK